MQAVSKMINYFQTFVLKNAHKYIHGLFSKISVCEIHIHEKSRGLKPKFNTALFKMCWSTNHNRMTDPCQLSQILKPTDVCLLILWGKNAHVYKNAGRLNSECPILGWWLLGNLGHSSFTRSVIQASASSSWRPLALAG